MPDSQRKNTDASQKARPYADPSRDTAFDIHIDQPGGPVPATVNPSTEKSKSSTDEKPKSSPELSRASASDTRAKTAGITPTDDMRNMLNRMQNIDTSDEIDDAEAARRAGHMDVADELTPVEARRVLPEYDTLPAVIRQDLATINQEIVADSDVVPDWHTIANLPGYMQKAIRAMGRGNFKMFTNTPLEEIITIANVNSQGPNSDRELNAVVGWLKNNAQDMGEVHIDYSRVMPGYAPRVREYRAEDTRFHVVMDDFGKYIYAYPEKDAVSLEPTKSIGHGSNEIEYDDYGAPIKRIRETKSMKNTSSISESIRSLADRLAELEAPTDEQLNNEIFESLGIEIDEANIRKVRDPETKRMGWKSTEEKPYSSLEKILRTAPGGEQLYKMLHRNKELWHLDADAQWGSVPFRGNGKDVAWTQFKDHPDKFIVVMGETGVAAVKPSEQQIAAQAAKARAKGQIYNPARDNTLKYQVKVFTARGAVPNQLIAAPARDDDRDDEYPMLHRGRGGLPTRSDADRNPNNIFDRLAEVIGYPSKIVYAQDAVPREKMAARAERDKDTTKTVDVNTVMTKLQPIFGRMVQQTLGRIGPQIARLSQAGNYDQAQKLTQSGQRLQLLSTALDTENPDWTGGGNNSPMRDYGRLVAASVTEVTNAMSPQEKNDFLIAITSGKAAELSDLLSVMRNKLFKIYELPRY